MLFQDLQALLVHGTKPESRPSYAVLVKHILGLSSTKANLFWQSYLRGCQPRLLSNSESSESRKIDKYSSVDLSLARLFCKTHGVSLQALIQATFARLLMEILKQSDTIFGVVQGGRAFAPEADKIIGPCMNTVPLRVKVAREDTFKDLLQHLHAKNIEMLEFIHTPLSQIQKQISKGPLFEALLVFQNSNETSDSMNIWETVREDSSVEFPLAVECNAGSDVIRWTVAVHDGYIVSPEKLPDRLDAILSDVISDATSLVVDHNWSWAVKGGATSLSSATLDADQRQIIATEAERKIAKILCQMTEVEENNIFRDTSFFSLGLDSISVIELSRRLRTDNVKVSVGQILRNPTVRQLQHLIASSATTRENSGVEQLNAAARSTLVHHPEISDADRHSLLANLDCGEMELETFHSATASQIYFLLAWKAAQGRRFMSNFVFRFQANERNCAKLSQTWLRLQDDHEILRTAFATDFGKTRIWQCVFRKANNALKFYQSSMNSISESISEYFASSEFGTPDLRRPPIGITVVTTGDCTESVAILTIHHALYDANSLNMLIRALDGNPISRTLSYGEFSRQVSATVPSSVRFWSEYLQETNPTSFVSRHELSESTRKPMAQLDHFSKVNSRRAAIVDEKAQSYQLTYQALLLSAISRSIGTLAQTDHVTIGMYSSGRSLEMDGIDDLFGPTVNVIPIRFDNVRGDSMETAAKQTHATLIEMNGLVQQVSVAEMHEATKWHDETGGLIDIAVNILPRRTSDMGWTKDNGDPLLEDYGRLTNKQVFWTPPMVEPSLIRLQINAIRKKYTDAMKTTSIDGFKYLHSVSPVLDMEIEIVDGVVNFGIFCDCLVLSEQEAETLVCSIWKNIEET